MLQYFSWPQFFIAAFILTVIWYIMIAMLYYRNDLKSLLIGKRSASQNERLPHVWEDEVDQIAPGNLMGKPAKREGLETVSVSDFSFSQKDNPSKTSQLGLVPDVLEELKTIFRILEKEDGDKSDFLSLLALTKAKHPNIGSNPNINYINDFLSENAPFMLSKLELENLWD